MYITILTLFFLALSLVKFSAFFSTFTAPLAYVFNYTNTKLYIDINHWENKLYLL